MIKPCTEQYDPIISKEALVVGALKKNRIFSLLTEEEMKKISLLFQKVDFKDKEYIFMEGDESSWVYIVTQDRVKTIKHSPSGRNVILEIKSPGDMIDCAAVLNAKPYAESAQAKGDVTVIRISHKNFIEIINAYTPLRAGIAGYLHDKLTDAYDVLMNIATELVGKRIISILLKYSEQSHKDRFGYRKINFPLTRQEIAEMVASSVETCIREMSKFQKQGVVKSSGGRIYIKTEPLKKYLLTNYPEYHV